MDIEELNFGASDPNPPSSYGISPTNSFYGSLISLQTRLVYNQEKDSEQYSADYDAYMNLLSAAKSEEAAKASQAALKQTAASASAPAQAASGSDRALQASEAASGAATGAASGAAIGSIIPGIGNAVGAAVGALGSLLCGGKGKSKAVAAKQARAIADGVGAGNVAKYFHCTRRTAQVDTNPQSPTYGFCVSYDAQGNKVVEPPEIEAQKMLDELAGQLPPETEAALKELAAAQAEDKKRMILYGSLVLGAAGVGVYVYARKRKK